MVNIIMDVVHTRIKRGGVIYQRPVVSPPREASTTPTAQGLPRSLEAVVKRTSKSLAKHVGALADGPGNSMARSCAQGVSRHHVLAILTTLALALGGLVQQSTTVALLALSNPLNSSEFAQYVSNTSYLTRHCSGLDNNASYHLNDTHNEATFTTLDDTYYEDTSSALHGNETESSEEEETIRKPRPTQASPLSLKVPLLAEDRAAATLRVSFLWGAMLSPILGWQLTRRAGAKRVLGWGVLAAGGLSLLVPAAWGSPAHIILRVIQGAATGVMWPALHTLTATWCPREQLSLFVSAYAAWPLGWGLAALIGPGLVKELGRDALFYVEAAITFAWFAAWSLLVANTPASANKDKWYVSFQPQRGVVLSALQETQPSSSMPERPSPAPWRHILTSGPVWGCIIAVMGSHWGQSTLRLAAPKYLQLVYGFSITQELAITSLPHFGHFLSSLTCGLIADHVISSRVASATTTRKMFVYAAHFIPAALLFVAGYTGCDPSAPAAMLCAAALFCGALPAGAFASALEIAPNYAGAVFALCHTLGALGGLLANYVITEGLHGSLPGSWRVVFGAASLALVLSGSCFLVLGSATEQPWNRGLSGDAQDLEQDLDHDDEDEERVAAEAAAEELANAEGTSSEGEPTLHPSATQMTLVSCA